MGEPEEVGFLLSGGIRLDVEYTPALLYQVAKMDGAIVLNADASRILWANVQLMPDPTIASRETGTRHRTAERVSKQTNALVIAVSARREVVSLYSEGFKYILQDIPTVLSRANQGLATLEKYRSRLDGLVSRLTSQEMLVSVRGGATLQDALVVLRQAELVTRMAAEVERYIIELGSEGRLIEMQLEESVVGVAAERSALVRDYAADDTHQRVELALQQLSALPHEEILDFGSLAELLGYDRKVNSADLHVAARGYRALGRIPRLPRLIAQRVIRELGGLEEILAATEEELASIEGVGEVHAHAIAEGLRRVQEVELLDRF